MKDRAPDECRLLILPDGRLLIRNLTPELTRLLTALQPDNPDLALRADLATTAAPSPEPRTSP